MPGAASPFLDTWAPPQFVYGSTGGSGPVRSTDPGDAVGSYPVNNNGTTYDGTITWKIAGTIILSLVVVFVLQASGFRFVGTVGIGG